MELGLPYSHQTWCRPEVIVVTHIYDIGNIHTKVRLSETTSKGRIRQPKALVAQPFNALVRKVRGHGQVSLMNGVVENGFLQRNEVLRLYPSQEDQYIFSILFNRFYNLKTDIFNSFIR